MKTFKVWSFLLGCTCTTLVWYIFETNLKTALLQGRNDPQREDRFISINEDIESESIQSDENVFFIETKIGNFHNLDSRQACSIESAALAYPNTRIFVMFLTKTNVVRLNHSSLIDAITAYSNVHLRLLNLFEFSRNTPLETFIHTDKLDKSKFQVSHTSDVLRILTLWKYGGTYLDLDVIVLRNTSQKNFACREDGKIINGAVLNLDTKSGKQISSMLIYDIIKNFDGSKWPQNGPDAITRVLKKVCRTSGKAITDDCEHFNLLPISNCYAIAWREWKKFFTEDYADDVKMRTRDSHYVHLWNKYSSTFPVKVESKSAIISIAQSFCPKVFDSLDEYF